MAMTHTIHDPGCGFSSGKQTVRVAHQIAYQKGLGNTTIRAMDGHAHIWDGFVCFTPDYGHLNTWAPLCWEQKKNHSKQSQPNHIRYIGWIPGELCSHSVILRDSDGFGTDWLQCPVFVG